MGLIFGLIVAWIWCLCFDAIIANAITKGSKHEKDLLDRKIQELDQKHVEYDNLIKENKRLHLLK